MNYPRLLLALAAIAGCDAAIVANVHEEAAKDAAAQVAIEAGDKPVAEVKGDAPKAPALAVQATVEPEALDLESINFLVKKGKVKDAAELEKKINDPKEKLNNVDIDGDGKVDKIAVVEVKNGDVTVFELKAIPSKTKDKDAAVVVAFIHFEPDTATGKLIIKATYAPVVIGHETLVYTYDIAIAVQGEKIIVVDKNPFFGWFFTVSRPVYVGVFVYDISPPPVIVIHKGKHWHKHKRHKGKGKWH